MGMWDFFSSRHHIDPAGPADDSVRADASRFGPPAVPFHWTQKPIAESPGAYNYAFDTLGLYEQYPIGAGKACLSMPAPFQQPVFAYQGVVTVGFGGLVNGDILSQPLYDPASNTYGGNPL